MNRILTIFLIASTLAACNEPEIISPDMTNTAYKKIDLFERIIKLRQQDPQLSSEVIEKSVLLLEDSVVLIENNCLKPKTRKREKCNDALELADMQRSVQDKFTREQRDYSK